MSPLPEAPRTTLDRVALGVQRWTALLYNRQPTFAAECSQLAARFDSAEAQENAKRAIRIAQANGYMNGPELITAIDILTTWEGAEPAAKMTVVVLLAEIGGGEPIALDEARVLTGRRWQ